jgi:serine protease AprX
MGLTQVSELAPEDTPIHWAELGASLQARMNTISATDVLSIIALADHYTTPNFVTLAEANVEGLNVIKSWPLMGSFMASVTMNQIVQLAQLQFVLRLELNEAKYHLLMDDARDYSGVDDLRDDHSEIDGNADGNITSYSKDDIVICIIDTGIDASHEDLDDGKVIHFVDLVYGEEEPYDDDGHGTYCASVAAGTGDASNGTYRGVAPHAALVGIRVFDDNGEATSEEIVDSLEWVAENGSIYGIDIVNLSWGGAKGTYDEGAIWADRLVKDYGYVVVAAAGGPNSTEFQEPGTVCSPGISQYALTAGMARDPSTNTPAAWTLAPLSGWGPDPCWNDTIKPDVLTPGVDITCASAGTTDEYDSVGGTSISCAFASGMAALWLDCVSSKLKSNDANSNYNPYVKHLMMASAVDMPDDTTSGKDYKFGAGRVDAEETYSFLTTDVSSAYKVAPLVLDYEYEEEYDRDNEPMWVGDYNNGDDWYKFNCEEDYFIYVDVNGDPDLVIIVQIIDEDNETVLAASYPGQSRNVGYWATYDGVYYAKVIIQDYSGDWYDIEIVLTASA